MATPKKTVGPKSDKLMRDALMLALKREAINADGKKTTKIAQIADKLIDLAVNGDVQAIKEIADRVDGRPSQAISGPDGGAIPVVHSVDLSNLTKEQRDALRPILGALARKSG